MSQLLLWFSEVSNNYNNMSVNNSHNNNNTQDTTPYAKVHFGSSEWKLFSARWPPTHRPSCKLDLWVRLWTAMAEHSQWNYQLTCDLLGWVGVVLNFHNNYGVQFKLAAECKTVCVSNRGQMPLPSPGRIIATIAPVELLCGNWQQQWRIVIDLSCVQFTWWELHVTGLLSVTENECRQNRT